MQSICCALAAKYRVTPALSPPPRKPESHMADAASSSAGERRSRRGKKEDKEFNPDGTAIDDESSLAKEEGLPQGDAKVEKVVSLEADARPAQTAQAAAGRVCACAAVKHPPPLKACGAGWTLRRRRLARSRATSTSQWKR